MSIVSYSQNFEDVLLWRALGDVADGFYVDVGAQHPRIDSVSQAFHEKGWRGIHIEPVAEYAALLRAERPGDEVIEAAVSSRRGHSEFHQFSGTGLSTLDPEAAEAGLARGFEVEKHLVRTITLDDVFAGIDREIHWLKIDVEGHERAVLESWDGPARPWILLIESAFPGSPQENYETWESLVLNKGYHFAWFDGLNRFYVSDAHRDLVAKFKTPPNVFDTFKLSGESTATFAQRLVERISEAQNEGRTHQQWAAEHLVNVEAAADLRFRALEADSAAKAVEHEQAQTALAAQFERDRQVLMSDHADGLREAASENRRLVDLLGQASSQQATMLDQHQAEREKLEATLDRARDRLSDVEAALTASRLAAQATEADAAAERRGHALEREKLEATLDRLRDRLSDVEAALTASRLAVQAAEADAAAARRGQALEREQLEATLDRARDRLSEVEAALAASRLTVLAVETDAATERRGHALEREKSSATIDALEQALGAHKRNQLAWQGQLAYLRSALRGEISAEDLTTELVEPGLPFDGAASHDVMISTAASQQVDAGLREMARMLVEMMHFSERFGASFRGRLHRMLIPRSVFAGRSPLAKTFRAQGRAGGAEGGSRMNDLRSTSNAEAGSVRREQLSDSWFGFRARARNRAIERLENQIQGVTDPLRERLDQAIDMASIIVAQGARSDEALSRMLSGLDQLTDIGLAGVSQGVRLENMLDAGYAGGGLAGDPPGSDPVATPSTAIALDGENLSLSPSGAATLDALARALRARNG